MGIVYWANYNTPPVSSDTRDLRVTGGIVAQTTVDLRITGVVSLASSNQAFPVTVLVGLGSNTTRDMRVSSILGSSVTRDICIVGATAVGTPSETSRDIRITGEPTVFLVIPVTVLLGTSSSDTRDIRITGGTPRRAIVTWANFQTPGIPGATNTTRDIRIVGQNTSNTTRDLRISGTTGVGAVSVAQDLRISGGLPWVGITVVYKDLSTLSTYTNDLRIVGQLTSSVGGDLRIVGQTTSNTTRDIRLTGTIVGVNTTRDLRVTGQIASALPARDLRIVGQATVSDAHDLRIIGKIDTFDTRDLRTRGQLDSFRANDLRIVGQDVSNITRDLRVTAQTDQFATGQIFITGQDANEVSRTLATSGQINVQTALNARVTGEQSSNIARDIRIFGVGADSVTRDIRIEGSLFAASFTDRALRISGRPVHHLHPDGDITAEWTAVPGGSLYSTIDEDTADESDYMKSPSGLNVVKVAEVSLTDAPNPGSDLYHVVRYRIASKELPSSKRLIVQLLQGSTEIASWTHDNIGSPTTFEQQLSTGQASTITDYSDLRLRFSAVDRNNYITNDLRITGA